MKFEGLYTALITPFLTNGSLDEEGLRESLRSQIRNKVQGVVVLGSTGESSTLSSKEKETIIQISVEEAKGKIEIVVGTGTNSTITTIEATKQAQELGADGAMIVVPYYNKPTQEGLYRHFSTVGLSTSLPLCIYNAPGRTGINILPSTLNRLKDTPSIVALKDCCANIDQYNEILCTSPHIKLLSGDDYLALPMIQLGARGLISIAGNLIPAPLLKLLDLAFNNKIEEARKLHLQLLPFFNSCTIETNPIPIKEALQYFKRPGGYCRAPLCEASKTHQMELEKIFVELPKEWLI